MTIGISLINWVEQVALGKANEPVDPSRAGLLLEALSLLPALSHKLQHRH